MTKLVRFDWAIKYLLRNKANFDILEGFLSELLDTSIHIESVLESEGNKDHPDDKFNRVDLLVKTREGQQVIIEVQCSSQWDYLSRILYGTSKVVCEYMREGDAYRKICKVISVSIVFFNLGTGQDYLYKGSTNFQGIHYHDTLHLNLEERRAYGEPGGLAIETPDAIFPEYYIIKVTAFHERVTNKFDEWVYFLKHGTIEENFAAQGIQTAAKKLDVLRLSSEERRAYEKYQEGLHDDASLADMLTISKEEGLAEGKVKGREEGRVEGRAEGRAEERIAMAKTMISTGLDLPVIAKITGLSIETLKQLCG